MKLRFLILPFTLFFSGERLWADPMALELKNGRIVHGRVETLADGRVRCHFKKGYVDFEAEEVKAAPQSVSNLKSLPSAQYEREIQMAARLYRIDPDLIRAVIKAESGFDPACLSNKGALGLMQLMPQTADGLGVRNRLDPWQNIEGGSRYLTDMLERFKGDLVQALAAYNAGPNAVHRYGGIPPYAETQYYVRAVLRNYARYRDNAPLYSYPGSAGEVVLTNVLY